MMDQMQDDQPEYWEPTEENDIEECFDYYTTLGLPIPSALWERMETAADLLAAREAAAANRAGSRFF